ncbi:FERM domain-containing protein 6-like isoform X2 [Gambusia affinis]|uniref:FERM domain-containing protein 6-like isoform X2 n=1 Tax=Gambusia affinis TaxID=33528 RepID=UPI001CDBA31D|nr:FERM domain-containing protein 6-like isoform X2 [Gambusia affinis]
MRTKQMRQVRVLLPNKQHLDCSVRMRARGQEVMKTVLRSLGVGDLQVFGLALLRENEYLFLDLEQKLRKYFGKTWSRNSLNVPFIVFLRVKFYLENGLLILSSKVQQLYYWELRQKVLQSQNHQQEALLFQLAASALQAEAGDLERGEGAEDEGGDEKKERMQYFLPEDYFPAWLINHRGRNFLLQHSPVLHGELRGTPRSRAILQFIKEASGLQDAALTFYRMKQGENELSSSILLGVALDGVYIYQEVEGKKRVLFAFTWSEIDRFTFQGSRFEIAAVDSKLVYYTHSAFHSKHILKHLSDSHRFYVNSKDAACYIQQLEDMQTCQLHREAYICDMTDLRQRLRCYNLTGSESDCSNMETDTTWSKVGAEEEQSPLSEVTWLAEFLYGVSVDGPLQLPSSTWAAVTMEMKQVLCKRVGEASHSFDSQ